MAQIIKGLKVLSLSNVRINDNFWNPRLKANREITIFHQFQKLKESGSLENFLKVAEKIKGRFQGKWFSDSDVYKWLEAACYLIHKHQDQNLFNKINFLISIIENAQEKNGYLNTYFSLVEPEKKWTNLGIMHELFCAGHLIQAAIAHYEATNKKNLLQVALKFVDHIRDVFGYGKKIGYPGHEEIELALVDLYRITQDDKHLELAKFFISQRGQRHSRFKWELENLENIAGGIHEKELYKQFFLDRNGKYSGIYAQDHCPVYAQKEVVGHAVRAMYLYCGMANLALCTGDKDILIVLKTLWKNMTEKRMYITGGVGSSNECEGFTFDFDLPNNKSYSETCAAVGNVMWNFSMLRLTGDAVYAEVMEKILYNNLLSGVSLDGTRFFYINPLESDGNHHRQEWFDCACCPPNLARLLASLERYIYLLEDENGIFIVLYISSEMEVSISGCRIRLNQETDYPWNGKVTIRIFLDRPVRFNLNLRIPSWSKNTQVFFGGISIDLKSIIKKGFARISKVWHDGDEVELRFGMPVERICSHPNVKTNLGRIALQRGPLIYCLEQVDNPFPLEQLILPKYVKFKTKFNQDLLNGVVLIEGKGLVPDIKSWRGFLYKKISEASVKDVQFRAIPYFAWGNRESGSMRVWIMSDRI
jgi:hypothetical protein